MGDVVRLPPRVTIEAVRKSKWTFALHARLGNGGVLYQYQCSGHPRLCMFKVRRNRNCTIRYYWCIERAEHQLTLEEAVGVLNGEPEPNLSEEEVLQRRWPLADQIGTVEAELAKRRPADVLEGLQAVLVTLRWLQKHETAIKQKAETQEVSHVDA